MIKDDPHSNNPKGKFERFHDEQNSLDFGKKLIEEKMEPSSNDDKMMEIEKQYGLGDQPYHKWDNQTILSYFNNNEETGYNFEQVMNMRIEWGFNKITSRKPTHLFVKLILTIISGLQYLLLIGGILCIIVYIIKECSDQQTLASGILSIAITIVTGLFQTYQERRSDELIDKMKALIQEEVICLRDSKWKKISVIDLVRGDIIKVKKDQKVPADLRVLHSESLKINNASLTGENVDINLYCTSHGESMYEAKNIARLGSFFTNGEGVCIVFSTGDNTFFGNISKNTFSIARPESCLRKEVNNLVYIWSIILISLGIIFLIFAIVRGYRTVEAVVILVGIVINVPKMLIQQMSFALILAAKKMQKKYVVLSNLQIIETLGDVSVICCNKTGGLTCNRMFVSHLSYDLDIFEIQKRFDEENSSFQKLLEVMVLSSNAKFENNSPERDIRDRPIIGGDSSEAAFIMFAQQFKDIEKIRSEFKTIHEIPFNSTNKWMLKVCQSAKNSNNNSRYTYYLKGAPERVLDFCKYYLHEGKVKPIDQDFKKIDFLQLNERLAIQGERVLAFAYKIADRDYPSGYAFPEEADLNKMDFCDFVYVGLVSLVNPSREGVRESIERCNEAGIRVFMVTGDQPLTALCMAKQLGLVSTENNGNDLIKEVEEEVKKTDTNHNHYNNFNYEINSNEKNQIQLGILALNTESQDLNLYESRAPETINCRDESKKGLTNFDLIFEQKIKKFGLIEKRGRKKETVINGFLVVNGIELLKYTQEDWDRTLRFKEVVFARTSPQQKHEIVNQLKRKDEVVAVTGEGMKDAPAMRAAHVGIAMGSGGSVAKDSAQMILVRDNFSDMVDCISEGRLIYENLKRCTCYVVASNVPKLVPFLAFIILNVPFPIEIIMIILIEIGTNLVPTVSFALEIEENENMKRPPRSKSDYLVNSNLLLVSFMNGFIIMLAGLSAWAWVYYDYGFKIYDLIGAGIGYRETWIEMTDERRLFFNDMCVNSSWYQINQVQALGKNCQQDFKIFLVDLLAMSQTSYLITVFLGQIACIILRKTSTESVLTWKRFTNNSLIFWAILFPIVLIIIVVYIPGLNKILLLTQVPLHYTTTGLIVIPILFLTEEVRKWLIRRAPEGCVSSCTMF